MVKLKVPMAVLKSASGVSTGSRAALTSHTLRRDPGSRTGKQPRGSSPRFDLRTRSSTGAPIQVRPLCFSSLASYRPSVS